MFHFVKCLIFSFVLLIFDFSTKLQGVMKLSDFMVEEDFLDKGPESISEIAFDNVEGN